VCTTLRTKEFLDRRYQGASCGWTGRFSGPDHFGAVDAIGGWRKDDKLVALCGIRSDTDLRRSLSCVAPHGLRQTRNDFSRMEVTLKLSYWGSKGARNRIKLTMGNSL
jgi:hypothetical protein